MTIEAINSAVDTKLDHSVKSITDDMKDAVTALLNNVTDQISAIRSLAEKKPSGADLFRCITNVSDTCQLCRQDGPLLPSQFVYPVDGGMMVCAPAEDGWLTIQRSV